MVLDEADKMLSQGLQPQLKRIRQLVLPKGRTQWEPDPEGSPGALLRVPARARPQVTGFPSLCGRAPHSARRQDTALSVTLTVAQF